MPPDNQFNLPVFHGCPSYDVQGTKLSMHTFSPTGDGPVPFGYPRFLQLRPGTIDIQPICTGRRISFAAAGNCDCSYT